jgi:hypothetical protein
MHTSQLANLRLMPSRNDPGKSVFAARLPIIKTAIIYGTPLFLTRFVLLGQNDLVGGRKKAVTHYLCLVTLTSVHEQTGGVELCLFSLFTPMSPSISQSSPALIELSHQLCKVRYFV